MFLIELLIGGKSLSSIFLLLRTPSPYGGWTGYNGSWNRTPEDLYRCTSAPSTYIL